MTDTEINMSEYSKVRDSIREDDEELSLIDTSIYQEWFPSHVLNKLRIVRLLIQFTYWVSLIPIEDKVLPWFISMQYYTIWNETLAFLITCLLVFIPDKSARFSKLLSSVALISSSCEVILSIAFWVLIFKNEYFPTTFDKFTECYKHGMVAFFMVTDFFMHKETPYWHAIIGTGLFALTYGIF